MSSILEDVNVAGADEEGLLDAAIRREKVDFKMVTFTLAGRQYAVNIMKVKEISKARRFTYVPNTLAFVEGVYNLRGDIITIINLRKLFQLPALARADEEPENIIILNVQENTIGVIVDAIENVVGVSSEMIQPRHPLFTDIQMKYISGVVDVGGKLYVILDVDRIFGDEEAPDKPAAAAPAAPAPEPEPEPESRPAPAAGGKAGPPSGRTAKKAARVGEKDDDADIDFQFVTETLAAFASFHVDETNEAWVRERLAEWRKIRGRAGRSVQLAGTDEAADFLDPFYSPYTDDLWGRELMEEFRAALWKGEMLSVRAWNPGTRRGSEAWSVCAILKLAYPKARVKVWACDTDLLGISAAPLAAYDRDTIPDYFIKAGYVKQGAKGWQFSQEMKDTVLFEYHDIRHGTELPALDLIVARDLLSFFPSAQKRKLVEEFRDKLTAGGMLVVGTHERISCPGFALRHEGNVVAYQKEKE